MTKQELEHAPEFCEKCGEKYPELFLVDDKEWKEVIKGKYDKKVSLCEECYDILRIKKGIKKGKRKHLKVWIEMEGGK